jgi:hypothetical protein
VPPGKTALANAKADLQRLKEDEGALDVAKLGKALRAGRDLVDALETKLTLAGKTLGQAEDTLRQALGEAQKEFVFLHQRKRRELIAQARDQIEPLFDRAALGKSLYRIYEPESLAVYARTVVTLDGAAGYYLGRYHWPEPSSCESVLQAVSELETRINQTQEAMY